jgi:hypothetical protein
VIEGINNAGIYASTEEPASGVLPRLAHVASGASLTLRNTSVAGFSINGDPSSGASCNSFGVCTVDPTPVAATAVFGGAIYAEGTLTLDGVVVHDNEAIGGHSGFVEGDDGPLQLQYAPKSGADAVGGAIYATGVVTINNSVLHDNAVQGGTGRTGVGLAWWNFAGRPGLVERFDGGAGGDARGADIALSGSSTASIRSSVFAASNAVGGNGAFGTTTTAARNLTQPRAADGTDGTCDDTPTIDEASGGQGTDGVDGLAGSSGGSGGDALGVVHADGTLVLDGVIIRDTGATGGSAGVAGLPQLGGEGGDGGDALTCIDVNKSNPSISKIYEGTPGAGGDAGWSGHFAPNGVRAEAVAAVSAGFDADVTILNTTITATRAVLADDAVDTSFDRAELLRRLALQNPLLGLGGSDADGNRARDGVAGPPSEVCPSCPAQACGRSRFRRSPTTPRRRWRPANGRVRHSTVCSPNLRVPNSPSMCATSSSRRTTSAAMRVT